MNIQKKFFPIFYLLFLFGLNKLKAQDTLKLNFVGLNPSVTIEPYYEKGEMDINLLPIVYQRTLNQRVDLRVTSICNLGLRKDSSGLSHLGLETAFPVFWKKKEAKTNNSKGLFVAPIISLTHNFIENYKTIGLWLEPGYNLLFDSKYALSFGLQIGGSYFTYTGSNAAWRNHFGVKVVFGKWLR
jgi:hypothetical protein